MLIPFRYYLCTLLHRRPWNNENPLWKIYHYFTQWNNCFISLCEVKVATVAQSKISLDVQQWKESSFLKCLNNSVIWAIFIVHMSELSSLYTWLSYLHCTHDWAILIVHMSELSSLYTWVSYLHCTHDIAHSCVQWR
jgi:hypothetical protein